MYSLQKASMWKRISAALFDFVFLVIIAVGIAFCLSSLLGYQTQYDLLEDRYNKIETEYGVDFDMTSEEYQALSEETRAQLDEALAKASAAIENDDEARRLFNMLFTLSIVILSFSILIAYLLLELLVPIWFKNGQTLGKKIFGVALMREDGIKVSPLLLFIRTLLGKYTLETMLPVLILMMLFFGIPDPLGMIIMVVLALTQVIMFLFTKTRALIHDRLSHTVCVDFATQMIFETPEELIEYKKKLQEKMAQNAPY